MFLRAIAEIYSKQTTEELRKTCFVFPNKRAGRVFAEEMKNLGVEGEERLPVVRTFGEVAVSFSRGLRLASHYEELFTLYKVYAELTGDGAPEFDRFRYWGETLIEDFDDVDSSLADARMLFRNVKNYKEIATDFLTDEQVEIIRAYWADENLTLVKSMGESCRRFWRHLDNEGGKKGRSQRDFLNLWEVLYEVYEGYRKSLLRRGLSTQGMFYRSAAEELGRDPEWGDLWRNFVFIGFNDLSLSELKIMRQLQRAGRGDFYWDLPKVRTTAAKRAMKQTKKYSEEFPSKYPISQDGLAAGEPKITIYASPTRIGQSRIAGRTIGKWVNGEIIKDVKDASDTAIILPDLDLFMPTVHSLPSEITTLNVTLGLPLRLTPVGSLMQSLTSLQMKARKVRGRYVFYHEDVHDVLCHPLLQPLIGEASSDLSEKFRAEGKYLIDPSWFEEYPLLRTIFHPLRSEDSREEVVGYLTGILDLLSEGVEKIPNSRLNKLFIQCYKENVEDLEKSATRSSIEMRGVTFLQMLQKTISMSTVPLTGEPLKGLQLMGVLETRALDFDNLVFLSMNEKVFPRKVRSRSLIPESLRYGYGLPTVERREGVTAYYFYRLLARARNVTLVYDSRTLSGKTNEMSRFLYQILYSPEQRGQTKHIAASFTPASFERREIVVEKDEEILRKLKMFQRGGEGPKKYLSASALNRYINCPLQFYLSSIEGLWENNEIIDYMDSSTYGRIVHEVFEKIYKGFRPDSEVDEPVRVTPEMLLNASKNRVMIDRYVTEAVNELYYRRNEATEALEGDAALIGELLSETVAATLAAESKMGEEFEFVHGEKEQIVSYRIDEGLTVNFKMFIDRLDRVGDHYRIVDYKTGGDLLEVKTADDMFDIEMSPLTRPHGVMQLFLYSNLLSTILGYEGGIEPRLYKLRNVFLEGLKPIKFEGGELQDYRDYNESFLRGLRRTVKEIFDPATPFVQAPSGKSCRFCQFKTFCGRKEEKNAY